MKALDSPLGADLRLRSLLAALHLASPALPVGGFAYSQGLETACAHGLVTDAASAQRWIGDVLRLVVARFEAPLWLRAFDADAAGDRARFDTIDAELLAARETAELRAETLQMGASLCRVLPALGVDAPVAATQAASRPPVAPAEAGAHFGAEAGGCRHAPPRRPGLTYPAAFAAACHRLGVDREAGLTAYLWAWAENQVLAAVKIVPLGQQAGQSMLRELHGAVLDAVRTAASLGDAEVGTAAVVFALTSARHESQYTRLFRS